MVVVAMVSPFHLQPIRVGQAISTQLLGRGIGLKSWCLGSPPPPPHQPNPTSDPKGRPGCPVLIPTPTPDLRTLRTALAVFGKGCLASSFNCVFLYTGELYPTVIR